MFKTVLVANRGEIALRVIRACRAVGVRAVAVYSDADAAAPHVRAADQAIRLGPAVAAESYLSIERVPDAARAAAAAVGYPVMLRRRARSVAARAPGHDRRRAR